MEGTAEITGTELALNRRYTLGGQLKFAVFSFHGGKLELGSVSGGYHAYVGTETIMNQAINVHNVLNNKRRFSRDAKIFGPRVCPFFSFAVSLNLQAQKGCSHWSS